MVDHQGRLSNPPNHLGRATDRLAEILLRPQPILAERTHPHQRQNRLDPEKIAELVCAYRDGASFAELAQDFGVHRTTVPAVLERNSVQRRPTRPKLNEDDATRAGLLYLSGMSLKSVADELHVDPSTIGASLRRTGVPLRARRGWPPK